MRKRYLTKKEKRRKKVKIKKKLCVFGGLLAVLLCLLACLFLGQPDNTYTASAAGNIIAPKMNYIKRHYLDGEVVSESKGVGSNWGLYHSESKGITYFSLSIRNQVVRPVDHSHDGEYGTGLDYNDISIVYGAGSLNKTLILYDYDYNVIATQVGKDPINITLPEGKYRIYCNAYPNPWTNKKGQEEYYYMEAEYAFAIDLTAPYLLGTSPEGEGKWVGIGHTVEAKDDLSFIKDFYEVQPDGKFQRYYGETIYTFQEGDKEGLHKFFCYDITGFSCLYQEVYFDGSAPTGMFVAEDGTELEAGRETDQAFSFAATDENSGVQRLEYKTPSSNDWLTYTAGTVIPKTAELGTYEFRAVDAVGNGSVSAITLSVIHDYAVTASVMPTCTTGGYIEYTCTDCGNNYQDEVPALGHNYLINNILPTCLEQGYTVHTCLRCKDAYTDQTVNSLGHDYDEKTIEATCGDEGYTLHTCKRCGDMYRDKNTSPLGHNYGAKSVMATCTEGGYTLYECKRCDDSYKVMTSGSLGHSYKTVGVAATCSTGGYSDHICSRCGDSYRDNISQPRGHNYLTLQEPPTCTDSGHTVEHCQICGYERKEDDGIYPTGHSYTNTIIKEPTCTTEGLRRSVCDDCGNTFDTVIAANGHHYEITDTSSHGGKTTRTYICTACNHRYKQELGDQYEEVTNYVEYLFEQYEPYMWWVFLAAAGVWSITIGVMIAIASKHEEKEKAKKMLVNYVIGLVVIAAVLVACPFLMRGIATLIT